MRIKSPNDKPSQCNFPEYQSRFCLNRQNRQQMLRNWLFSASVLGEIFGRKLLLPKRKKLFTVKTQAKANTVRLKFYEVRQINFPFESIKCTEKRYL